MADSGIEIVTASRVDDELVDAKVDGSLAIGGFEHGKSDFVVVTDGEVGPEEFRAHETMHERIAAAIEHGFPAC